MRLHDRGDALFEPLSRYYGSAVRRTFVEPVLAQDMKDLANFRQEARGRGGQPGPGRARVRALLQPAQAEPVPDRPAHRQAEPAIGESERAWITAHRTGYLPEQLAPGSSESAERQRRWREHLDLYLKLLATDPSLAFTRNDTYQRGRARRAEQAALRAAAAHPDRLGCGARVRSRSSPAVLGGTAANIKSKGLVRGAFTRKGWDKLVRERLELRRRTRDSWCSTATQEHHGRGD